MAMIHQQLTPTKMEERFSSENRQRERAARAEEEKREGEEEEECWTPQRARNLAKTLGQIRLTYTAMAPQVEGEEGGAREGRVRAKG